MAARTVGCVAETRRSAVFVLVLLWRASLVWSESRSLQADHQNVIEVSYFPNSENNFGIRGQLSEAELKQQELDVLQLKNEIDVERALHDVGDVVQNWDIMQHGHHNDLPLFRTKRAVTAASVTETVAEDKNGTLINFLAKFSGGVMVGRSFEMKSASAHEEKFEVTSSGQLKLRDGYHLDYEDETMRSIEFVVHATSRSNTSDVYSITATLTVTNVDEPPVFETQPQPYLATVRSDTGSGYVFITLVARDPEGAEVQYEKRSVSPNDFNNRIELRTVTRNGVRQCELVTVGSERFQENKTFSVTVSARDRSSGGLVAIATVSVVVGVRPPQFFQSKYQGSMPEKNRGDQTVYKRGTSEELKIEWKTFQAGDVRLTLAGDSEKFRPILEEDANQAFIICTQELDYETANPKIKAMTLTAIQKVGQIDLPTSISLTVEIEDTNDNRPVFEQSQYLKTVQENITVGTTVLEVIAKDKDTGLNAAIEYSLLETEDFEIITKPPFGNPPIYKGAIRSKTTLDYDRSEGPYYIFKVKATDRGSPPQTSTSNIRVAVSNVNDEAPQFLNDPDEEYSVQESADPGQFITQIQATDRDGDRVTYSFSNGRQTDQKFKIDQNTGLLTLDRRISDNDDRFTLTILAKDDGSCCGGGTKKDNQTTIYVQVYGVNSERPDFKSCSQYNPSVDENAPSGTSVISVLAEDNDRGPNGVVSYTLTQSQDVFAINRSTGLITIRTPIDREISAFKQVTVKATDGGNPAEESYCSFRVTINDVNDNAPRFDKDRYVGNITLGVPVNVPFLFVRASDSDVGTNARIAYSLPFDAEGKFNIIPENGFISLAQELQQEDEGKSFSLTAMAKDEGSPVPLNSTVSVRVNVERGTTEPPAWDKDYNQLSYTVKETISAGTVIIPDMVCDSKIADKRVEFQLVKEDGTTGRRTEFFEIEPNGTSVSVKALGKFDYTKRTEHTVHIRCLSFGTVALLNETNPKVLLEDTNNQIPEFQGLDDKGRYAASVQENKPNDTIVGTVEASDKDTVASYNEITFSITDGGDNFTIEQGTKRNTAIIKTKREFDREEKRDYFVTIKATDGAPSSLPGVTNGQHNTATVIMNVKISDVNDNPPEFKYRLYNVSVEESTYINDLINPPIKADDADDTDNGRHTYRIVSGNTNDPAFGIRNGLGNLFPLRKLDYENGDKLFLLVVEASDGIFSATTSVNVTVVDVNDNSPVFTPVSYHVGDIVENDNDVPRSLLTLTAIDADVDRPNDIRYSLEGSSFNVDDYFSINSLTGELYINEPLDRDPPQGRPNYQFTVKAADELQDPNFGYATVSVTPLDLNDNRPEFVTDPLEASVYESSPSGTSVVRLEARDNDYEDNGTVVFSIENIVDGANVARPGYFRIDGDSGIVETNTIPENLDRETEDKYFLTIKLKDKGPPGFEQENSGILTVTLSDQNDQPPIFQKKIYTAEMTENLQNGEVIRVIAKDNDIGDNAKISYVLDGPDGSKYFSVTVIDNEGSVQIGEPVDYEVPAERFFNLTVKAQDNAGHEDICYVEIYVLDFNDNTPDIQPKTLTGNVSEAAPPGTTIATFTATDDDVSEINREFEFSISRASDPRRHFSIGSKSGQVKIRRKLDRETEAEHELTILAIDKGSPPLTGTASLTVVVEDVNDNSPTFKEDYNPHIMENKDVMSQVVQVVLGKDPDAPPYGAPFGFKQGSCASDCSKFGFQVSETAANRNGSATISVATSQPFDREDQKYYYIPIVMWDMRGTNSPNSMTGTNTLTITIADENDNTMYPGTQDIFVYNYKGMFGPLDIGRVYVKDLDDWDLPDKVFNYTGPDWMNNYFTVDYNTGMVTMNKGVPSNVGGKPYTFSVRVYDKKWDKTVTSTVKVTVEELSEEAVRNSGATRFRGTNAEAFIKVPTDASGGSTVGPSAFTKFNEMLADKLNTEKENVQIISVQDVVGGFTDVRYAVHGSPYYPPSQTDSIVVMNKEEFERELDLDIEEVPIDACAEEVFEGGCYNYMDITGNPALVNANGTSFVGVEVFIRAMEGCRALDFPEPNECSGDYCYHGGTCVKNDFGVLSCINCPEGFEGPRCQQLRHRFDGRSYAMYPTLEQCEDSETSIEFVTLKANGLLFYNGPMTPPEEDRPQDFISLELKGGMPVLYIDHGSGSAPLSLDGKDQSGREVMGSLADGKWHKIDIVRKGKFVEMVVDDCEAAAASGSESNPPDTTPCRATATTAGENSFLNVATLLYVGGRSQEHSFPSASVVTGDGFEGCVRNLVHNSKYYDLHYKETPGVPSGQNGCPPEDEICADQNCGEHGICVTTFRPPQASCVCKPGWRGSQCSQNTMVRDLKGRSFIQWQLNNDVVLPNYLLEIQVMYRTWDTDGVLFTASSSDNTKRVTMELKDRHLQVLYNLDNQDNILMLSNVNASDGFWHVARFKRVMYLATLTLDQGEGRNHASQRQLEGNVYMALTRSSPMYGGASVTNPSGAQVVDRDLEDTCVQDVRLNGDYLPIKDSENSQATLARFLDDKNVEDGCSRDNTCVPVNNCNFNEICVPLWGRHECRCAPGYHETASSQCESDCQPDNPCFLDVPCSIDNGTLVCTCAIEPWYGTMCNLYPTAEDEPALGMATGAIVAIVVSILVVIILILLAFFLVTFYKRKKSEDDNGKFVVEDDADFDIRENVIFYDEEGAGEEDQNAFDLAKLPTPASEVMKPPVDMMPRSRELPRGRAGVPDDRPDVGDVLHNRLHDADGDPDAPPHDTLITFNEEGAGSDAGSLSSLGSSSSDASQDYDYLNDWGPKFAKLADMYGAGQE